ncbi:LysM peptidoglycan-binding domain-containing protein [Dyella mobilis]|uniref:LysM peptidoglycan-binding domain-containing protein n=1 Tax=Dyella mobilis TaxID=1849582 RepID=A0ABS2KID6_9GAMM|nr:LysM peptidoglycan-binding domain-containing protein [Dyella mobilis]MBM7130926.1 LysM peptidoglycan-binding domain-containing protein [Dyella mobilis]GLQ97555.1 lytic transglycosylase [Dyella mobilis]
MSDCDADPQIMVWAHRYTQNPQRFEEQMSSALPQLIYVEQVAEKYDVAGEFALLPWVESQYRPVPGHRNLPAGMWQIVSSTARVIGLHSNRGYDGRLDTAASTDSVMRMLHDYYDNLHDWRLVDYAFNRGEFGMQRMVQQHGLPPDEPAIPKLPVPRITREHLTKLLAISCVVREPERFNVELPTLAPEQHLETVQVRQGMTLSHAANSAGMDTDALKRLNPALQTDNVEASVPGYLLMMPRRNAEQLRTAMQMANDQDMMASLSGSGSTPTAAVFADKSDQDDDGSSTPAKSHRVRTHTVRNGESLWQIAKNYSTSVNTLERLNHLHGKALKPGQVLKLDNP